jgi:hypothetical protein
VGGFVPPPGSIKPRSGFYLIGLGCRGRPEGGGGDLCKLEIFESNTQFPLCITVYLHIKRILRVCNSLLYIDLWVNITIDCSKLTTNYSVFVIRSIIKNYERYLEVI